MLLNCFTVHVCFSNLKAALADILCYVSLVFTHGEPQI